MHEKYEEKKKNGHIRANEAIMKLSYLHELCTCRYGNKRNFVEVDFVRCWTVWILNDCMLVKDQFSC